MRCSARIASPTVLHVAVDDDVLVFQFTSTTLAACCLSLDGLSNGQPVVVAALDDRRVAELFLPATIGNLDTNIIAGDPLLKAFGSWPADLGAANDIVCASVPDGAFVLCVHGWARVGGMGSSSIVTDEIAVNAPRKWFSPAAAH
jgi:hypothetical protein